MFLVDTWNAVFTTLPETFRQKPTNFHWMTDKEKNSFHNRRFFNFFCWRPQDIWKMSSILKEIKFPQGTFLETLNAVLKVLPETSRQYLTIFRSMSEKDWRNTKFAGTIFLNFNFWKLRKQFRQFAGKSCQKSELFGPMHKNENREKFLQKFFPPRNVPIGK